MSDSMRNMDKQISPIGPKRLPDMLRYVDRDIPEYAAKHKHPSAPEIACPLLFQTGSRCPMIPLLLQSDALERSQSPSPPALIALSPCGHWMHLTCLIWQATHLNDDRKNKCPICRTELFEWEGITALTLAVREGLYMPSGIPSNYIGAGNDRSEFMQEVASIEALISQQILAAVSMPSRYFDGSPDLMQCLSNVLKTMQARNMQKARWLKYSGQTGCFLFMSFVGIKMRRYLVENVPGMKDTQGWKAFEVGLGSFKEFIAAETARDH